MVFSRSGNHLIIRRSDSDDQLTLQNYYYSRYYRIERMEFADGTVWDEDAIFRRPLYGGEGNDSFTGIGSAMTLYGLGGNDTLTGGSGNDVLHGGDGNDSLHGGYGNDTLVGGTGNDYLNGGRGNDRYLFDKGWGQDTLRDYDSASGNSDTLVFGDGIAPDDLVFSRSGNHLIIRRSDSDDQLTLQNYYYSRYYRIERMEFADGTVWDEAAIFRRPLYGGEGNDSFTGIGSAMTLYGLGGNDTLTGGSGNDMLYGGDGNDSLHGGYGNDTLVGGTGNDYLNGGRGNDTYLFDKGWGQDTVSDYDSASGNIDTLVFGDGIAPDDLVFSRSGNHLIIRRSDSDDQLTLQNYYYS
ncbi:MAG: calcium-binding protein, partial [Actinobacteria bacterium]|nr:calcium-binding protein [Actinomycetota bacterium]